MPWQRPPSWLYLPHQDGGVDLVGAKRLKLNSTPEPKELEGRLAVQPSPSLQDDAETDVASARDGPSDPAKCVEDASALGIRGRYVSPGMGLNADVDGGQDGHRVPTINGPASGLGASGAAQPSREQVRLDERNARLKRSLSDHAERVAKKKLECRQVDEAPSAADRIAAVRRRILQRAARAEASAGADRGQELHVVQIDHEGGGGGDDGRRNTTEVSKIQLEAVEDADSGFDEEGTRATATEASLTVAARRGRENDAGAFRDVN